MQMVIENSSAVQYQDLIGKDIRKPNMTYLGTIVNVECENDAWWNCDRVWIITDSGEKIWVNKIGKITDTSVTLRCY